MCNKNSKPSSDHISKSLASKEAEDFKVNCEKCGTPLDSDTVIIGMGKIEAYSFKCKSCSLKK